MGRPTKLTSELQATIVHAIEQGLNDKMACLVAGVSEATFYNWRARGAQDRSGRYVDFLEACTQARARGEAALAGVIYKAATGGFIETTTVTERTQKDGERVVRETVKMIAPDWRAAAFTLSRRYPADWGLQGDANPNDIPGAVTQMMRQMQQRAQESGQAQSDTEGEDEHGED